MNLIGDQSKVSGRAGKPGQNSLADNKRAVRGVRGVDRPPFPPDTSPCELALS